MRAVISRYVNLILRDISACPFRQSWLTHFTYALLCSADSRETPLQFEVPLPSECTIAGTTSRSYNQGQCSREPCRSGTGECALGGHCCFEVGQTAEVALSCTGGDNVLQGGVIVACRCQPCGRLQAHVRGRVLSSRDNRPVMLAAILIDSEMVTFTDQEGGFFFQLTSIDRTVQLRFQEASHAELEMDLDMQASLNHEVGVVLEYIQTVYTAEEAGAEFEAPLADARTQEDARLSAALEFPASSLMTQCCHEDYTGPAKVMHSLYHVGTKPDFSAPPIHHMVYQDSRGVEFSIEAFLLGSLRVVDEGGRPLLLRPGSPLFLSLSLQFDRLLSKDDLSKIHLFVFSDAVGRWLDHGLLSASKLPGSAPAGWVALRARLRELSPFWAVGVPSRITCYVKVRAFQSALRQELVGLRVVLEQSDDSFGRTAFYRHTAATQAGTGACLGAVCKFGGLLEPRPQGPLRLRAVPPSVGNGITMGEREQIVFYSPGVSQLHYDGRSPYYVSETACKRSLQQSSAAFQFTTNDSVAAILSPSLLPPLLPPTAGPEQEVCFVKVGVYDCAAFSDVKVVSFGPAHQLLSLHADIATRPPRSRLDCSQEVGIVQLRASCVQYACGSEAHITVQSRREVKGQGRDCRYWSSSPSLPHGAPPTHDLTVFTVQDSAGGRGSPALYRAAGTELARLKCLAGSETAPGNSMDPYQGTTVTFTCLV